MRTLNRHYISKDRGQAQVEFLLSVLSVAFVIFWVLQFMVLVYTYVVLAGAAKEGVRYAIVHGARNGSPSGPSDTTGVQKAVQYYANYTGMSVVVTYPDGNNNVNSRVRVTVSYPFLKIIGAVWSPPTIKAAAQGRIVY